MSLTPEAQALAVIVVAVVILWITEALPLAVTALLGQSPACSPAWRRPGRCLPRLPTR